MPDNDDGLDKAFEGFGEDPAPVTPPTDPPATPPAPAAEPPKDEVKVEDKPKEGEEDANKDKPTDKPEGTPKPGEEKPTSGDGDKPADPAEKPGEGKPAEPAAPEAPQPLTKDDVQEVVSNLLNTERSSSKELEDTAKEVLDAYYPDGLSNVLVDEQSGKELRTPQDVVDASNGEMTTEQAAQWLMNEQFKLDKQVDTIKNQAKEIAETTVKFKRDAVSVLQRYEPLFKAYPYLQDKVYQKLMKQVKVDKDRGVILSAPDVIEHYDDYLEPYQLAFEHATKTSATNPTPNPNEPPKPTAEDRMDEGGDGGTGGPSDDPNDFAQQVNKELAKGI